jgi:hypothetical protein
MIPPQRFASTPVTGISPYPASLPSMQNFTRPGAPLPAECRVGRGTDIAHGYQFSGVSGLPNICDRLVLSA